MMINVTFLQTSDPYIYAEMLGETSRTLKAYCQRHNFQYEYYVGVKRGGHNWQATFNRLYMFDELIQRGRQGWAVYLDADAYIVDLDFDLRAMLTEHSNKALIASGSGASDQYWDINAGILLFNLDHPNARFILRRWKAGFEGVKEEAVEAATDWFMGLDDQALLHEILRDNPWLQSDFHESSWDIINSPYAKFMRQCLRASEPDLASRIAIIREQVSAVLQQTQS